MTISLDDFRSRTRLSEPVRDHVQALQAQVHEAVRAGAVTGRPEWDAFLEHIEARIKLLAERLASQQAILCHPSTVNVDRIMEAKIQIVALEAGRQALEEIVLLPKMLVERGAAAKDGLKDLVLPE